MQRKRSAEHGKTVLVAVLLGLVAMESASPVSAQIVTGRQPGEPATIRIHLDAREGARMAERSGGRLAVSDFLRRAGSVELRGPRAMDLTVHVFRMRGGSVLEAFRSGPVSVTAGEPVSLGRLLQPGSPKYGDFFLNPEWVVEAGKTVSAGAAIEDPGSFVINGVIPYHPKGWETMDSYYAVAVPADRRQLDTAVTGFAGMFASPER